jgi:hypothetical protein
MLLGETYFSFDDCNWHLCQPRRTRPILPMERERAFGERDASLVWLQVAPEFDSVRSDPRFADWLRRMNFPGG